jgi:penicillin-binding protein 1A
MFRKTNPNSKFNRTADGLDRWLDSSAYKAAEHTAEAWAGYAAALGRWHIRGVKRIFVDLVSDALTFGTAIGFLVLYFAVPPLTDGADVWHLGRQYAVTFRDTSGQIIGRRGIRQNDALRLDEIPPHVINAVLATEDTRFYDHFGVDFQGTFRAMIENLRARDVVQGGSTITQQLAKNLFLTPDKTIKRKMNEAMMALWIEIRRTKRDILKLYLDRAYLGGGTYGVEAAAQFYFGKSIRHVSLAEAAMLAGLFKAPSRYAPHINIQAARGRASVVLDRMVAAGFISEGEAFLARRKPAKFVKEFDPLTPNYFLDWAYRKTLETLKAHNLEKEYVVDVTTTVNLRLQRVAQAIVNTMLDTQGRLRGARQAALVSMARDGAVKVIVGGRDYEKSQFNRATDAKRQPGSSFKPIVYMTALRMGMSSRSIVVDAPVTIGNWSPRNYSGGYRGRMTMMNALTRSINTVAVRLSLRTGRKRILQTAKDLGLTSKLISTPSLPLGTSEVTVIDLTTVYASLANGGQKVKPYGILEIRKPTGETLYQRSAHAPEPEQTIDPDKVAELTSMLHNVVVSGTGRRAFMNFMPAAGKTGTTSGWRDAWFMGFTKHFVTGVWFGNDDFRPTKKVTGGFLPAMTWRQFMERALEGKETAGLPGMPVTAVYTAVAPRPTDDGPETKTVVVQRPGKVHPAAEALSALAQLFLQAQKNGTGANIRPPADHAVNPVGAARFSTARPGPRFSTRSNN